jgi:hypothetical protein
LSGFFDGGLNRIKPRSNSRITSCQQQERLEQQRQQAWRQQQERQLEQQEPQQLGQERQEQRLLLFYRKRPKQQQR